ncbi:MAG TPA: bifunctional diaminohydroxyphosphoribosylaminopyrimidine deaminase/5-amino-6-(5-phosphoribosylamino)uracil reductase RibD [Phycisphaerales bacterium]|nr:MAG: riboflavin biosynthesis protein RibD [Planctomycetes bacterium GWC2_45_44]HBG77961.1 bifunctional diaminohydroxyphosphoribosylaminopyrimidine deaminase/5-amino-6-(5-phosphoribosylamino)uracil reductase RibD [Phycisphaerales bacterium]HBR18633.1 bifunctional diaminohydroxyphosphoribosylaminopyrimidine deaminase/5-amino-6-(5-phosphoribosylamino)uracil reductase RibD [Phycisphaerales bacterium]
MPDTTYIKLALKLAHQGLGSVEPNPMVGCVIVKNGKIIGEGYHRKFGGPHAEINALADCKKRGNSPAGATMYVSLEPCCHFGKTPPCVNAIIAAGIKKVVAAVKDPTKKVAGKGFKILKKAGIEVIVGVCENEAKELNAPFFKFAKTGKPYIIVKWAQSSDGFLSRTDGKRWITNAASRKDVHKIRRKVGAILVGINTVIEDNPMLTARPDRGRQPLRIVLGKASKLPRNCYLLKTAKKWPVYVFNGRNLNDVLVKLGKRGVQQLLVEGGEKIITSFLKQKLADEIIVYISNEKLGAKGKVPASQVMVNILKNEDCRLKIFNSKIVSVQPIA